MDRLTPLLQVDWSSLDHAYGPAAAAPAQLLALVGDDPEARNRAVGYLEAMRARPVIACRKVVPDVFEAVLPLVTDPDPGVRACAALAPAFSGDERATRELLSALSAPQDADQWFTGHLPGQ